MSAVPVQSTPLEHPATTAPTEQVTVPLPASTTDKLVKASFDQEFVAKVRKEVVFDGERQQVQFEELIKCEGEQQHAIVVFIRHFVCGMCQDYVTALSNKVNPEALKEAGVRISIVGCGDAAMIPAYVKLLNCPFPIYTQPSKQLHQLFGMSHNLTQPERGDYITRSNLGSAVGSITNFFKMGKLASPGDFSQNGGEYVWTKDYKCIFDNTMRGTTDHAPIMKVLEAANATSAIKKT